MRVVSFDRNDAFGPDDDPLPFDQPFGGHDYDFGGQDYDVPTPAATVTSAMPLVLPISPLRQRRGLTADEQHLFTGQTGMA